MSITASNNPFPHDPNENFGDKLDRGGYPLTAQDLKNDIDAIAKPDGFLKIGVINKVGNAVTIAENQFEYRIDQIEVENQAFSTTIVAATDGYRRIDIIVGLKSGSFVKIQGIESIDSAQEPQVPDETIKLTSFNVFGSDISYPNNPIEGSQYVQKSERNSVYLTGSGVINQWDMVDEKATIVFNGTITRLNTVSYSSVPYAGKTIRLFNAQSTPVTIGNSVSDFGVDFVFPNGQDYILQPNQTIEFSFDITYAPYAHHMFIGGAVATASGTLKTQKFIYTSGLQEFTTTDPIGEVVVVFRNGKGDIDFTNTTTKVTVTSPLLADDEILIIYASEPVGISPYYTKAEMDTKYLLKADYNELEYLFVYRKALDVSANMMLDSVGNNAFTDMGFYLDQNYILDKLTISFARFVNTTGLLIPVQLRVHQEASSTPPTPTTGQIIQEAECFAAPSNVFNKVFTFDLNFDLTDDTGTFLTVNTGNFSLAGATLADMLVVVKLKKKV